MKHCANASTEEASGHGKITMIGAFLILINSTVGAALMNFPYSVVQTGAFATAFVFILTMLYISVISAYCLVWSAKTTQTFSYQELIRVVYGKWGLLGVEAILLLFTYVACMYIQIGISEEIERIALDSFSRQFYCDNWFAQRPFLTMVFTIVVILPQCLAQDLKELKLTSLFALLALCYILSTVVFVYAEKNQMGSMGNASCLTNDNKSFTESNELSGLPIISSRHPVGLTLLALSGISIGFCNQFSVIAVYSEMKIQTISATCTVYAAAVLIATILYVALSYCVIQTNGLHIQENFIMSYDSSNWLVRTSIMYYMMKLAFEYPVIQYVGWSCIYTVAKTAGIGERERLLRISVSLVWCTSILIFTTVVNNLLFFSPFLAIFSLLICYVTPGCTIVKTTKSQHQLEQVSLLHARAHYVIGVIVFFFGCFISGIITTTIPDTLQEANEIRQVNYCSNIK